MELKEIINKLLELGADPDAPIEQQPEDVQRVLPLIAILLGWEDLDRLEDFLRYLLK